MAGIVKLLNGGHVVDHEGKEVDVEKHFAGKTVGLYFSAHWCPPCRGFTPALAEFHKNNSAKKNFEVIFISSDRDEESFKDYFAEMPWVALAFADRNLKAQLCSDFGIKGIPSLVIVDGNTGKVNTTDGRSKVMDDPNGDDLPWSG